MPHLALSHDRRQRLELFLEGNVPLADALGVVGAGPEQGDVAVGPVNLQEVDKVGAEPLEAALDALLDLRLGDAGDLAS